MHCPRQPHAPCYEGARCSLLIQRGQLVYWGAERVFPHPAGSLAHYASALGVGPPSRTLPTRSRTSRGGPHVVSLPPHTGTAPPRMHVRWLLSVTSPSDRSLGQRWPSNRQPWLPAPPESPPRRARQRLGGYLYSAPSSLQGPHDPAAAMSRARPSSGDRVERVHPEHDRVDGLGAPRRLVAAGLGEPPRRTAEPSALGSPGDW